MEFSVIVPVYNVEGYLPDCVDSLLNQTWGNAEILLIDDGSTDQSGRICDAYAGKFPGRVRVLHQANCGADMARVMGLKNAAGDICVFVDADDCLRRDGLEQLHRAFEKTGADVVLYAASRDEDFVSQTRMLPLEDGSCFEGKGKRELYALMIRSSKLNNICMKAAKKVVYDRFLSDYGPKERISYGEDLCLSMPLITHGEKIAYLADNLYFYRFRPGSAVNSFHPRRHDSIKTVRKKMESYLEIWQMQEYYPVFYARVVENWVEALKILLKNRRSLTKQEMFSLLGELSEDDFFQKAYRNMAPEQLPAKTRHLARWLYRGRLVLLWAISELFAWIN